MWRRIARRLSIDPHWTPGYGFLTQGPHVERAMPQYLLAKHIHFCEIGNQVIFLDLRRDRYFAIAGADRQTLNQYVSGWPSISADGVDSAVSPPSIPEQLLEAMMKSGVLTDDAMLGREASVVSL